MRGICFYDAPFLSQGRCIRRFAITDYFMLRASRGHTFSYSVCRFSDRKISIICMEGNGMFLDLVKKSRSFRGYDRSRKISRDELEYFTECTRFAPSTINKQPFRYYLACDEETVARIQPATKWARNLPDISLPHPGKEPVAFIVICMDSDLAEYNPKFMRDVGIVAQTMLLAAAEKDLGGCMIGNYDGGMIKEIMGFGDNIQPLLVVAFGKPDENIIIKEVDEGESVEYYRDAEDNHYLPKRKLKDIILN